MAVWTVRILDGADPEPVVATRFSDVDAGHPRAAFIERLAELGVTTGCGDGTNFCPDRSATRAQMAAFLSRAFNLDEGPDPGFGDVPADAWYAADVAKLAASGITTGCGDGSVYCPDRATTRAEGATFLARAVESLALSPESPDNHARTGGGGGGSSSSPSGGGVPEDGADPEEADRERRPPGAADSQSDQSRPGAETIGTPRGERPDGGDAGATAATSSDIAVGTPIEGTIGERGDSDWYSVSLTGGSSYRIDLQGRDPGGVDADVLTSPKMGVYDSSSTRIPSDWSKAEHGLAARPWMHWHKDQMLEHAYFRPSTTGTYYIAVRAYADLDPNSQPEDDFTGAYTLTLTDLTATAVDDAAASTLTEATVAVGGWTSGTIDFPTDTDWIRVSLTAGPTYHIVASGESMKHGTLPVPILTGVRDHNGNLLSYSRGTLFNAPSYSSTVLQVPRTGDYLIDVRSVGDYAGTYRVTVTDVATVDDDFPNDESTDGELVVGSWTSGEIEVAQDKDWFKVALTAHTRYEIYVAHTKFELYVTGLPLVDPLLAGVIGPDLARLPGAYDDHGGLARDARIEFTPSTTGSHYVEVGSVYYSTGVYEVRVSDLTSGPADTINEVYPPLQHRCSEAATHSTLSLGVDVDGEISNLGERDWYKLTVPAETVYKIEAVGALVTDGGSILQSPDITGCVLNGDTYEPASVKSAHRRYTSGGPALVYRKPATESTFYYGVSHLRNSGTGGYRLTLTDESSGITDDYGRAASARGSVAVGGTVIGNFDFQLDTDWFTVDMDAGETYLFTSSTLRGSPIEAVVINIYDDADQRLDGLARYCCNHYDVFFTAPETGSYTVEVANTSSALGAYRFHFTLDTGSGS